MAEWNHSMCERCWNEKNPNQQAYTLCAAETEECCFCGDQHSSGIYIRQDPRTLACVHAEPK